MKLMIIHPHLNVLGGSEILTRILIYELEALGNEVIVLTGARNEEAFPETSKVKYALIKDVARGLKTRGNELLRRLTNILYSIDEVLKKEEPETVLLMIQEPIYGVLTKATNPKMGVSIYIHFPYEEELTKKNIEIFLKLYRFPGLYENLYRVIDLHITNSNYTASVLYKDFGVESNIVYPAVPWGFFTEEVDIKESRSNVIVNVGRFVPHKRQDLLVKWFKERIKPEVKDAKLYIIGIPDPRFMDYYERLKSMVAECEGVELVDRALRPEEMAKYHREAKLYVHLRIGEPFGMAPVEAMSQGAIPILPRKSGLAEVIAHGRNGFLFNTDDEALNYIIRLLKTPNEELVKIRKSAYIKSLYFTPERFTLDVLNYMKILT